MRDHKLPFGLENEPDTKLKRAVVILWNFVHLHGLSMDLCARPCAKQAIHEVEELYFEKKEPEK